jgi:O-antigen ligase
MEEQAGGRRDTIAAAVRLWQRFPLLGSGHGTFASVVSLEQREDVTRLYNHAHDDYAEIAATAGTVGIVIALAVLLGGWVALVRSTFGAEARELTWMRRAFQAAALASITIAMVHALFDFNFFIPANPSTLAAIAGAAVASVDRDKRTRR